jgi:hypothetical protein
MLYDLLSSWLNKNMGKKLFREKFTLFISLRALRIFFLGDWAKMKSIMSTHFTSIWQISLFADWCWTSRLWGITHSVSVSPRDTSKYPKDCYLLFNLSIYYVILINPWILLQKWIPHVNLGRVTHWEWRTSLGFCRVLQSQIWNFKFYISLPKFAGECNLKFWIYRSDSVDSYRFKGKSSSTP